VVAEGVAVHTAQKNASFGPKSDSIKLTQESAVGIGALVKLVETTVEVVETTVVREVFATLFVIEAEELVVMEVLAILKLAEPASDVADVVGLMDVVELDEIGVAAVDVVLVELVETAVVGEVGAIPLLMEVDGPLDAEVLVRLTAAEVAGDVADVVERTGVVEVDEIGVAYAVALDVAVGMTEPAVVLADAATAAATAA